MKKNETAKPDAETAAVSVKKIILVTVVSTFVTSFMGSALTLSIPAISSQFELSAGESPWIITAYMVTCTSFAVLFGRLADMVDRKTILVYGLSVFTAATLGCGTAQTAAIFLLFRMFQGLGTAMIYSTSMSILVLTGDEAMRGKLLGYSTASTYGGLSAGPVIGGLLTGGLGWRSVFFMTAAVSGLAVLGAIRHIPPRKETGFVSRTWPSASSCFLCCGSLTLIICGLSLASRAGWGWILFGTGGAGLIWYGLSQQKKADAVVPVRLFTANSVFLMSGAASMINYGTSFVMNYFLSVYLQLVQGYSPQISGLILAVLPLLQSICSPFAGKLSDRISPHLLTGVGMAGTGAAAVLAGMAGEDTKVWQLILILAISGVSSAGFASPNTAVVMGAAGKQHYSIASSVLSALRSLGHSLSMAAAGLAVNLTAGGVSLQEAGSGAVLASMKYTLFLFGGLCFAGIFMAMKKKV